MPDFPVLDGPYSESNGRVVITEGAFVEPYVDEIDGWCTIPIRVTHTDGGGLSLELGPYTLDRCDVTRLRNAIRSFDLADNGPAIRRVQ